MTLLHDVISSEIATATRWQKLYRTLYHIFLKNSFVHVGDYRTDLQALNTRIATLEANINKEVAVLKTDITAATIGHAHPSPPAPVNPVVTGPGVPVKPPTPPVPSATPVVAHVETALLAEDSLLQATGPSAAPLGQGISPEVQKARIEIKSDIGLV